MRLSRTGIGAVATALAATLVLAGCSGDDATETPEATEPAVEQTAAPEAGQTGPVDVPDVTNIILETAQGNLMRKGLESTVVDESGAAVTVDDATAYVVVAQDPADGQLEAGETVTLTVVPRG
jgi:PBP1b-binding outer membrane lipoprotein LpoB